MFSTFFPTLFSWNGANLQLFHLQSLHAILVLWGNTTADTVISFPYLSKKTNMANIQRGCCQEMDLFFLEKNSLQVSARHAKYHLPYVRHRSWHHVVWAVAVPDDMTRQSCCVRLQLRSVALSGPRNYVPIAPAQSPGFSPPWDSTIHHRLGHSAVSDIWEPKARERWQCFAANLWHTGLTARECEAAVVICVSHAQCMRLGKFSLTCVQEELPVDFWN